MKKSLFLLGMASAFALTGCYGLLKSDYAKFKEKATEACKETPDFKQVKIKGEYDAKKVDLVYDIPSSIGSGIDSLIDAATGKYNAGELKGIEVAMANEKVTYFTGSDEGNDKYAYYTLLGFKVETGSATYEYDFSGILAGYKSGSTTFSFAWVK